MPDFEGLALFAKVAEARSFAAASRELGLSVPTLSRGIARLERRLGARVFNRTSRQLALTPFGELLLERASRLYRDAEETEALGREQSASPRGLVRLAVPMAFGVRWLAPVLPDFLARYPEVSVDLHLSDAVVDIVAEGFDAAVRIAALPDSSLAARLICPVRRFIVASPAFVASYGAPTHPAQLNPRQCLGYAYRANTDTWHFRQGDEEATLRPEGPLRVTNAEALLPVLLAGHAVAELPEFLAGPYLRDGRLVQLLPQWYSPGGGLYFVTPTIRSRPAKVGLLSDYLVERLSEPEWRYAGA